VGNGGRFLEGKGGGDQQFEAEATTHLHLL